MRKIYALFLLLSLVLFLSVSSVSAADSTDITADKVANASDTVKSCVETNHTLPNSVNISGTHVNMPQYLEISTTVVLNINSGSNATITPGNYGSAQKPSETVKSGNIGKTEYLDIANRVKSFMNSNGRAPNYASSSLGKIRYESLIYMYAQILDSYNTNNALPDYVTVKSWTTVSTPNIIGSRDYGYVEKEVYGNQSSSQTIVLIVGVHPQENGIHTAIAKALANKSANLSKRYVIYKIHVTKDANDYSKGRMNGQLLAQEFVVPDVHNENPMLVIDNHENHGASSGYEHYRFLYPISNTSITTTYANEIISKMSFLVMYSPRSPTSTKYVTEPIANQGITTIIYETYFYDPETTKIDHANALIDALDELNGGTVNTIAVTANPAGGDYYSPQNVVLAASVQSKIYYTLDGTDPTASSTEYTSPINIAKSAVLKFFAKDSAGNVSGIRTENYRIYALSQYSYTVSVPYKKGRYKKWYKKWYKKKVKRKIRGKWKRVYVWEYKWKYKWKYGWLYRTETRYDTKWVLT